MSKNKIQIRSFIAMSLDGFIATPDNGLEWLNRVRMPKEDYGYKQFYDSCDSLLLGRNTYDVVRSFGEWPYAGKKVFIATHRSLEPMADEQAIEGNFPEIIEKLIASGVKSVYIDGGELISAALQFKLLDQLTVSVVPSLLGKGVPLFKNLQDPINLETIEVQCFDSGLVQMTYEPRPLKSPSQSKR